MSTQRDVILSAEGNITSSAPAPPTRTPFSKAADALQDENYVRVFRKYPADHTKYITLVIQDVFNSLVAFYANRFRAYTEHLSSLQYVYPPPAGVNPYTYMARVYISHWIHDLYVSNREACKKHSFLSFSDHYSHDDSYHSYEYDAFLQAVNSSIRPTRITGPIDRALYVPVIAQAINWTSRTNPFNITDFSYDKYLLQSLLTVLKDERVGWRILPLMSNAVGRPCWLFDWHTDDRVCAWFPESGNYNEGDAALAYVIGVACTPTLGPRDADDWQFITAEVDPETAAPYSLNRVINQRWFGAYEVRTVTIRSTNFNVPGTEQYEEVLLTPPPTTTDTAAGTSSSGTRTGIDQPSGQDRPAIVVATTQTTGGGQEATETADVQQQPQTITRTRNITLTYPKTMFQIIDHTYFRLVNREREEHTRIGAFRTLVCSRN